MKPFDLVFEEGPLGTDGSATYVRGEMALSYAPAADRVPTVSLKRGRAIDTSLGIYAHPVYLIADTLTMKFDDDRTLVALDAYTNADRWSPTAEEWNTKPIAQGRLQVRWNSDSDRASLAKRVTFAFARTAQRLHIRFDSASAPEVYYHVGAGLAVALKEGEIQEIVISAVTFV